MSPSGSEPANQTSKPKVGQDYRPSLRALRTARRLLIQVEQVLHALPDGQCPTRLLEDVRRFNLANGGSR